MRRWPLSFAHLLPLFLRSLSSRCSIVYYPLSLAWAGVRSIDGQNHHQQHQQQKEQHRRETFFNFFSFPTRRRKYLLLWYNSNVDDVENDDDDKGWCKSFGLQASCKSNCFPNKSFFVFLKKTKHQKLFFLSWVFVLKVVVTIRCVVRSFVVLKVPKFSSHFIFLSLQSSSIVANSDVGTYCSKPTPYIKLKPKPKWVLHRLILIIHIFVKQSGRKA